MDQHFGRVLVQRRRDQPLEVGDQLAGDTLRRTRLDHSLELWLYHRQHGRRDHRRDPRHFAPRLIARPTDRTAPRLVRTRRAPAPIAAQVKSRLNSWEIARAGFGVAASAASAALSVAFARAPAASL